MYLYPLKAKFAPTQSPTQLDITWAAGLFEGEGSSKAEGLLSISQVNFWVVAKLRALFGGSIHRREARIVNGRNNKAIYEWSLYGARARGVAMTIFSFMSPKRKDQLQKLWR